MKTIKAFCEASHISPAIIRAVVRQLGGWDAFRESAADIANHGADGGFSGFIYYADTVRFARKNLDSIIELAADMARDIGEPGAFSLIAGFNCLRGDDLSGDDVAAAIYRRNDENAQTVYNALAWFALEEVARAYVDLVESEQ